MLLFRLQSSPMARAIEHWADDRREEFDNLPQTMAL